METRKRGRPAKAPPSTAPVVSRRGRRQTEDDSAGEEAVIPTASAPVPRRGAPRNGPSSPSIHGGRRGDGLQSDDDSDGSNANVEAEVSNTGDDEASKEYRQLMRLSLPDLAHNSKELLKFFAANNGGTLSPVKEKLLQIKRRAFSSTREIFDTDNSPKLFLDWTWFEDIHSDAEEIDDDANATLTLSNLAGLVSTLYAVQHDDAVGLSSLISELDSSFPYLFGEDDYTKVETDIALSIRTARCIFALKENKGKNRKPAQTIIASIFCEEDTPGDAAFQITNGPFVQLPGTNVHLASELLSRRAESIYRTARTDKKGSSIDELEAMYSTPELLSELREWAMKSYKSIITAPGNKTPKAAEPEPEVEADTAAAQSTPEQHGEDSAADSQDVAVDTQPIERPGLGASIFKGVQSVTSLFTSRSADRRHTIGPGPDASQQTARERVTPSSLKRPFIDDDEDDDEDDGAFQTDRRPINQERQSALRATHLARRPRIDDGLFVEQSRSVTPLAHRMIRPASSEVSPVLAQMRQDKREVMQRVREMNQTATVEDEVMLQALTRQHQDQIKRRIPWSDHDTELLIGLIQKHKAMWAEIARSGTDLFDTPRNQQACRDRARNLKVDFLLADAVLPREFDRVALGKKEVERIVRARKNPLRVETDVDDDGYPTNTLLVLQ